MGLFTTRRTKALEQENENLSKEVIKLMMEISELKSEYYSLFMYNGEFEKTITEKLELSPLQVSRLRLLFSIERCRAVGVDEDLIVKYDDWEKGITNRESVEES